MAVRLIFVASLRSVRTSSGVIRCVNPFGAALCALLRFASFLQ